MPMSDRFIPVHRIAKNNEKRAAQRMGVSQKSMNDAENRLEELRRYRQEYADNFNAAGRLGMSAVQVQEYQAFLARLNEAIRCQEAVVNSSREQHTISEAQWLHKYQRSQALEKVLDRFQEDEREVANRQEQKEADEHARRSCQLHFGKSER